MHVHARVASELLGWQVPACGQQVMKFARTKEVVSVPIEDRSRGELLDLLEQTRSRLEHAEILPVPLVYWDGSEGTGEQRIIEMLGLLVVAYEVRFYYYEIIEMGRKLLLTAVLAIFFSAALRIYTCVICVII